MFGAGAAALRCRRGGFGLTPDRPTAVFASQISAEWKQTAVFSKDPRSRCSWFAPPRPILVIVLARGRLGRGSAVPPRRFGAGAPGQLKLPPLTVDTSESHSLKASLTPGRSQTAVLPHWPRHAALLQLARATSHSNQISNHQQSAVKSKDPRGRRHPHRKTGPASGHPGFSGGWLVAATAV